MIGSIHWIKTNGDTNVEKVTTAPEYEKVKEFLAAGKGQHGDTWLERVNVLYDGKACGMYVDEEGSTHWKRLPVNEVATEHYHRATLERGGMKPPNEIHGRAVLMVGVDFD